MCVLEYNVVWLKVMFSYFYPLTLTTLYIYLRSGEQECGVCMCVPFYSRHVWKSEGDCEIGFLHHVTSEGPAQPIGLVRSTFTHWGSFCPCIVSHLNFVSEKYTTELRALCTFVEILSLTLSEGSRLFIHVNLYIKFCI